VSGKKEEEDEVEIGKIRKDERTSRFFTSGNGLVLISR
jgi:hypothetical protein